MIIIGGYGFVTITCEEENVVFQCHISEIDEKAKQMCFNVNGKDIYVDIVPCKVSEIAELDSEGEKPTDKSKEEEEKATMPTTSKSGKAIFSWCDTSTQIFLKECKVKKELVKNGKLNSMEEAFQEIADILKKNDFNVSPLQVKNRYKTLKRAFKNMMIHKRRDGRGKYICSYEQDLAELFSNDIDDTEMNDDDPKPESAAITRGNTYHSIDACNFKTVQHNARLEAQNVKIIESLQSCQHLLKNLITRMDDNKHFNDMQNKVLQVCMEMQKEAIARAEEQRKKTS